MNKGLLTVKELAQASGYSVPQIHNQIKLGNIKAAFTSNSLILISRAEFDRVVGKCLVGKYKSFKRVKKAIVKTIAE
jgi:hypothetical protein